MPLNDTQAINDLIGLYGRLEDRAKIASEEGEVDVDDIRRFKAEETVKIFKAYIMSGDVVTTVTGTTSDGKTVTGQGQGKIQS